jgi:hypothetical protein
MKIVFLVLSTLLPIYSPILYTKSILKGEAKPHRTTRFVILLTTILTTLALFAAHDRVAIWLSAISALQAVAIFALSLKYGMGGWAKTDIVCLVLALVGIVVWKTTTNPLYGVYFGILADFLGVIPTIIKTYRFPESELWSYFAIDTVAGMFNLLALPQMTFQTAVYPLYIVFINGIIAILAIRPKIIKTFQIETKIIPIKRI